jgi:hypothetical protein
LLKSGANIRVCFHLVKEKQIFSRESLYICDCFHTITFYSFRERSFETFAGLAFGHKYG